MVRKFSWTNSPDLSVPNGWVEITPPPTQTLFSYYGVCKELPHEREDQGAGSNPGSPPLPTDTQAFTNDSPPTNASYILSQFFFQKVVSKIFASAFSLQLRERGRWRTFILWPCPETSAGHPAGWRMTDGAPSLCAGEAVLTWFCPVSKTGGAAKTNSRGMSVNSKRSPRCEADPQNETSRMMLGIAWMSNILSQWKDRGRAAHWSVGDLGRGWGGEMTPDFTPEGQGLCSLLATSCQCSPPLPSNSNMTINRSYQKNPCSL